MRIFVSIALAFFALCSAAQAQSGCTGQTSSGYICGNLSASTGLPGLVSGTSLFDRAFGSTPGSVLNRTTSWGATTQPTLGANGGTGGAITLNGATSGSVTIGAKAAAGTSTVFNLPVTNGSLNNVLITDGAGNTSWVSAGSGTVSSVGLSMPGIFTVTNSPVVNTGTLTATLNTQSANLIWAGPSTGAASAPTFRSLVGADLPNPSASTLGGVQSFAAVTSQWIRQISTSGVPTASQPAFSDISGVAASTQLPNPTATTLGGIESYAAVSNQWINTISTSGVPSSSQPGFSNLSGQASLAQLPGIGSNTVLSNTTGGTATPLANSLSSIIDNSMGSTQGDVLYRNATGWVVLAPGTSGQVFTTGGAAANPSWASVTGTGTVTSVATNNGITGGTFTTSGTIALANITTGNVMANVSGGTTYPTPTIPSAVLDVIGSTEGSVLYRGASTWLPLTPGTNGQYLQTTGAGSTPQWASVPATFVPVNTNLLPNTQWQIFDSLPVMTKENSQGTGTQAQISVTSYSASGIYNTFITSNTQQLKAGDLVTVTANADPVLTLAPFHIASLTANTSFGALSPYQLTVGATSTATITPITVGDISGSTTQGPTGWTKTATMVLWRDDFTSNAKAGSKYTLGMRKGASGTESLNYTAPTTDLSRYQGRNVVCGGWVLSKLNVGNGQWRFRISDGTQTVSSAANAGAYTWAEVTATISTSATTFQFGLDEIGSNGDGYYLSQPICNYGTVLGTGNYIAPPGEHIWFRNHPPLVTLIPLTRTFPAATFTFGTLTSPVYGWEVNIEAITEGAVTGDIKDMNFQLEFVSPTAGKQVFNTTTIGMGGILIFGSELNTPTANITIASNSVISLDNGSCTDGTCLNVPSQIGNAVPEPGYWAIWTATSGMTYTNLTYDIYGATLR